MARLTFGSLPKSGLVKTNLSVNWTRWSRAGFIDVGAPRRLLPTLGEYTLMKFVLPSAEFEESYVGYIAELGGEERYPFTMDFDFDDFPALLRKLSSFANGLDLPSGFVPSSTYWLVEDGVILGVSNLRHYLNERIREVGGHIGLGIRPSCRGRGLGKMLLRSTIERAAELGIFDVHIHCYKSNEASARMIIANGCILHSEVIESSSGKTVQRYVRT